MRRQTKRTCRQIAVLRGLGMLAAITICLLPRPSTLAAQRPAPVVPDSQFQMPDTSRFRLVLENALVAYVIPDPSVPLLTFTAFVRAGRGDDEQHGAAEMLALMLASRGPCWMAPGTFQEALQEMAADFRVEMAADMTEITLRVMAEHQRQALRIFSGIVREACIDEEGLSIFRNAVARRDEELSRAAELYEGSMNMAIGLFNERLFGPEHPYGQEVHTEDAERLTVEHVEDFYHRFFMSTNTTLAVAGDFDLREIVNAVDQRFADWAFDRPPSLDRAAEVTTTPPSQIHRYATPSTNAWFVIGHELARHDPADRAALEVMNYILAGEQTGERLAGGTTSDEDGFGVRGYLDPGVRGPGTYTFRGRTAPGALQFLIDETLAEVDRMRHESVPEAELETAKKILADGLFAARFQNGHVAARTFALEWARYGSMRPLAEYQSRIRDVSAQDVQRAAERFLHPDRMIHVILSPQSSVGGRDGAPENKEKRDAAATSR